MPSFLHDRSANVGMMFALSLPVLGGFAGLGMDATRQMAAYNNLQRANKMACNLLQIEAGTPVPDRLASATAAFNAGLGGFGLTKDQARIAITGEGPFVISSEADVPYFAARMVGVAAGGARHTLLCDMEGPPPETPPNSPCNVVLQESFEQPRINDPSGWKYFRALPGWSITSPDNQIELQDSRSGGSAQDGDQFLELDTENNNSTISRELNLESGNYEIRFFYRPELWTTPNPASHTMRFCFENTSQTLCTNSMNHYSDVLAWRETKKPFKLVQAGRYRISFQGTGIADSHGAQIDNIRICRL